MAKIKKNRFPDKCIVDTNVPITANLALAPENVSGDLIGCVSACIEAIEHVVSTGCLVIDAGDEIFSEYRGNLRMNGQPGIGDRFVRWVHDNRWTFDPANCVLITSNGETFMEFPNHPGLANFDPSDKKFIAVSNAHPEKPPILQATDSKWWGWKEALNEVGIEVHFLCPDYAQAKFEQKKKK